MDASPKSTPSSECECPCSIRSTSMGQGSGGQQVEYDMMFKDHLDLLTPDGPAGESGEACLAPIMMGSVLNHNRGCTCQERPPELSQFGLLAGVKSLLEAETSTQEPENRDAEDDPRLLFNVSIPSSTFICGSQGSGKSHTLSCMLENCLIPSKAARLSNPLTGIVFHYDTFISDNMGSPCEAAYLSSLLGDRVRVLCSPTNLHTIRADVEEPTTKGTYSRFGIRVEPLEIDQKHLNTKRMLDLMAVGQNDGAIPLYMHTVKRILRNMRIAQQETGGGFDYQQFKQLIMNSGLTPAQIEPLNQRLDTLESFMPKKEKVFVGKRRAFVQTQGTEWEPSPGRLTIVDLSCPCISAETACSLFDICLSIFLEQSAEVGRVVALDEAHKYMNTSIESRLFTETLLSTVRLQRHLGARIIISTQEPTISKSLLDLCSTTIVHRFTSPEWLKALKNHLAAAASTKHVASPSAEMTLSLSGDDEQQDNVALIFDKIVSLRVGEALLFSPSAVVGSVDEGGRLRFGRLGSKYLAMKVRARLTLDGGKSVLSNARNPL